MHTISMLLWSEFCKFYFKRTVLKCRYWSKKARETSVPSKLVRDIEKNLVRKVCWPIAAESNNMKQVVPWEISTRRKKMLRDKWGKFCFCLKKEIMEEEEEDKKTRFEQNKSFFSYLSRNENIQQLEKMGCWSRPLWRKCLLGPL